jgi:hypothetical protein
MKVMALANNNYSQVENFLDYEDFLGNSYFTQFNLEYIDKGKNLLSSFLKPEVQSNALEIFSCGLTAE